MGVNNLNYSKNGLALTELFEGDILTAYQDPRGIWTIGYGHTADVHPGQTITHEQAVSLLFSDLRAAVQSVNGAVTVKLSQSQFDALVDFTFNVGAANFRHSTLLRDINEDRFPQAIAQFNLWDHCGGIINAGLLRRRNAESAEFTGDIKSSIEDIAIV
jgi:lysozyme